jgi:hypothetical protein
VFATQSAPSLSSVLSMSFLIESSPTYLPPSAAICRIVDQPILSGTYKRRLQVSQYLPNHHFSFILSSSSLPVHQSLHHLVSFCCSPRLFISVSRVEHRHPSRPPLFSIGFLVDTMNVRQVRHLATRNTKCNKHASRVPRRSNMNFICTFKN